LLRSPISAIHSRSADFKGGPVRRVRVLRACGKRRDDKYGGKKASYSHQ